jgi:hypoxanthine phosphoribosyltransferase
MVERDLRIGLVDDVLTTGSTLEAAGNAPRRAAPEERRNGRTAPMLLTLKSVCPDGP